MKRVLIVDDDKDTLSALSESLVAQGHSIQSASDAEAALHRLRAWKPHLVLVDVNMPDVSGMELVQKIREVTASDYTPIIMISADTHDELVGAALDAGADDYLAKPFRAYELLLRVRGMLRLKEVHDSLRRANHRIEELSSTDDLTGLLNSRSLYRKSEEEITRSKRFRKPVVGMWIDLDGFADVNQNCGFMFGNHVLREAGQKFKQSLRSIDHVARIGGDEFFVVLLETDLAGAEAIAEKIRESIESTVFRNEKQSAKITVSIGIAGITPEQTEFGINDLLHNSAEALRSAKANGRNRVEIYSFV